jgi:hypothetical protein
VGWHAQTSTAGVSALIWLIVASQLTQRSFLASCLATPQAVPFRRLSLECVVGNIAANTYRKLGVHAATAAVNAASRCARLLRIPNRFRAHPRTPQGEPLDIVLPMTSFISSV